MQSLLPLSSLLGFEKTLVITCHECLLNEGAHDRVFAYQCLGNMLRKDDYLQQECIRYYLEVKGCTQIILAGHNDCSVIRTILDGSVENSLTAIHQYNLEVLLKERTRKLVHPTIRNRMLIELNVMEQLKLLMGFEFIQEKVKSGFLKVVGVIMDYSTHTTREIFRNGISFNNIIISN